MSSLLLCLKFLRDNRTTVLSGIIVALLLLIRAMGGRIVELRAALASKPVISQSSTAQVRVVRVEGPVRIVEREKIVKGPGEIVYVDRVIEQGPITTDTGSTVTETRQETPVAAIEALRPPRWVVGASTAILEPRKAIQVRAGYSFFGRLDLSGIYSLEGPGRERPRAEVALRF